MNENRLPLSVSGPLVIPAVAFAAGIVAATSGWSFPAILTAIIAGALLLIWLRLEKAGFAFLALGIGAAAGWLAIPPEAPPALADSAHLLSGTIRSAHETEKGFRFTCLIDSAGGRSLNRPVPASVVVIDHSVFPAPGMRATFSSTLEPLESSHYLPDETDFTWYLRHQGLSAQSFIEPDSTLTLSGQPDLFFDLRYRAVTHLLQLPIKEETVSFLAAVLLGDSTGLPPVLREDLSRAGVAHILALSGLHVGIIAVLLSVVLFPFDLIGRRRWRRVLTIAALWAFVLLTGCTASVTRAALMATILLVGQLLGRSSSPLNSLAFAALLILAFSPWQIYSIGFQMTFAAAASIALLAAPLNPFDRFRHRWLHAFAGYVTASAAAMMAAGLLSTFYFHSFPVLFLIGNVIAALPLPALLFFGVADMAVGYLTALPEWMAWCTDSLYLVIARIAAWVSALPHATIDRIYFPWWTFAGVAGVIASLWYWRARRRPAGLCAAIAMTVITAGSALLAAPRYAPQERFEAASLPYPAMVVRTADTVRIVTTAPRPNHEEILHRFRSTYADYCGRRSVNHIEICPDTFASCAMRRIGGLIDVGADRYAIISHGLTPHAPGVRYALIVRGYRGTSDSIVNALHPDTLVLHPSLSRRRLRELSLECDSLEVPWRPVRTH